MVALFRFAVINALILSLVGCNIANMIKMRYANDDLTPNWPDNVEVLPLPTHYGGEKPYIDITINGTSGFRLLIDTGASITYLPDTPKVRALGLEPGYELAVSGWGDDGSSKAYQSMVNSLELGGVLFNNVNVAVIPTSESLYYLREDEAVFDGVLGHDVLRHFTWTFDKQMNQVSISKAAYSPVEGDIFIPFEVSLSKLEISAEFNMGNGHVVNQPLLIDTGSRHYIKLSQTYVDKEGLNIPGSSVTAADFGLSGRALHQRVTLPSVSLGGHEFENVKTNLIVTDDEDDLWVVGNALLNQFVTIVDYQSDAMYLRPYPNNKFSTRYNLLGMELRKITSGEFVVRYVMPDMAMANLDVKEGDLITAINGTPAAHISQDQWLSLSASPGKYEVCRKREKQICLAANSKHIEGYSRFSSHLQSGAK